MRCPECGITYDAFKTGLTYNDVYQLFWKSADAPGEWRYKRRHTILGKWNELKKKAWLEHLEKCGTDQPLEIDLDLDGPPDRVLAEFDFSEY